MAEHRAPYHTLPPRIEPIDTGITQYDRDVFVSAHLSEVATLMRLWREGYSFDGDAQACLTTTERILKGGIDDLL